LTAPLQLLTSFHTSRRCQQGYMDKHNIAKISTILRADLLGMTPLRPIDSEQILQ
jgi:hypothetical protein